MNLHTGVLSSGGKSSLDSREKSLNASTLSAVIKLEISSFGVGECMCNFFLERMKKCGILCHNKGW